jgi:hypothetical protein
LGLAIISTPYSLLRLENLKQQLNVSFAMEIILIMCWSSQLIVFDAHSSLSIFLVSSYGGPNKNISLRLNNG